MNTPTPLPYPVAIQMCSDFDESSQSCGDPNHSPESCPCLRLSRAWRELERELAECRAERDRLKADAERIRLGLMLVLDPMVINKDNIGDIRRSLFLPISCVWNTWVREETAARENQPPRHPDDVAAAIDAAMKEDKE